VQGNVHVQSGCLAINFSHLDIFTSYRFTKVVKKPKSNKDKKHSKASKKTRAALLYGGAGSGDEAYDATAKMGVRENVS
jgi:hypothetical protein